MLKDFYISFIKKHKKFYIFYIATMIAITPLRQVAIPHYYGKIIDKLKDKNINSAIKFFCILLVIWIVIQILNFTNSWAHLNIWPRFAAYTEEMIFDRLIKAYKTNFQELKVGEIITKIIKLPWILDNIVDNFHDFIINNTVTFISNIGYLTYHSFYLGGIYIIGVIALMVLGRNFNKNCRGLKVLCEKQYDHCHGVMEDIISNLISVYTNKQEESEKKTINKENIKTINLEIRRHTCALRYKAYFSVFNVIIFIALNGTSLYLYKIGKLKIAALVTIFILNYNILSALLLYYTNVRNYIRFKGDVKYFNDFIKTLPKEETISNRTIKNIDYGLNIEIKNVKYRFPNVEEYLYNNLNLSIPANQNILIMGNIGSGKSTFAKILTGLQRHESGNVLINNVDISKLNINNVRNNIVYVPQMPILFDRTLWENINYGLPKQKGGTKITRETIYSLLKELEMYDTFEVFKAKMDKPIGKKGSFLSGGQRQIVWLLRCVLKKCKVIILDEPTSALDKHSKGNIIKMIKLLSKDRTLIVISHDTELMEYMERLIVFDKGKIIEDKLLPKNK